MDQDKKAYRQSLCVAGVIMAFALAAFLLSLPMPDHAPIFPRMASAFLFACGAGLMVGAVRRHRKGLPPETPAVDFGEMQSPLILLLLVVVYALGFKYVGFYVTTLVIVVASMLHMGIRSGQNHRSSHSHPACVSVLAVHHTAGHSHAAGHFDLRRARICKQFSLNCSACKRS